MQNKIKDLEKMFKTELPTMKELDKVQKHSDSLGKKAYYKFMSPFSKWKWYVMAYDPEMELCYGLVDGDFKEWGSFTVEEVVNVGGILVEDFDPQLIDG